MSWFIKLLTSSIGKKFVMALTGFFLISFLIVHLSGNFSLFAKDGGVKFNAYSEFMTTFPLIKAMEIGLVLGFLLHILQGVILYFQNKQARPIGYTMRRPEDNSTFTSRTMIVTGSLVLFFLITHLLNFLFKHRFGHTNETMFQSVKYLFQNPMYSGLYLVALIVLGFHLHQGFQSAFQTFGLNHKKYSPAIKYVGNLIAVIITLLFATMPLYFLIGFDGGMK